MAKTLTLRLDDETEDALRERAKDAPDLPVATVIRDAIGEISSVVYFIRRSDGAVKIGFSASLRTRLIALRRELGSLRLEAMCPGGRDEEARQHRAHSAEALGHEWFKGPLIEATVARVAGEYGVPDERKLSRRARIAILVRFLNEEDRQLILDGVAADGSASMQDWAHRVLLRAARGSVAQRAKRDAR
jgi:hypothetical protein